MKWIRHPRHIRAQEKLVERFKKGSSFRFRRLRKIVFLCGAAASDARRHDIRDYLAANRKDCSVFYADDVWFDLSKRSDLNSLEAEDWLARISDVVLLVVESAGSIAELGAFSMSELLRKKLLPVVDRRFASDDSFINSGPIAWVNKDSTFAPSIDVSFSAISRSASEIEERLGRISYPVRAKIDMLNSPKHLLFFLCDLVSVTGPISVEGVESFVADIFGRPTDVPVELLLSLATSMKLIRSGTDDGEHYFFRHGEDAAVPAYLKQRFFNVCDYRATYLGSVTSIPEFAETVVALQKGIGSAT